ncbi:MAG: nitroreductase family protein [Acidimicrobiales bacterium]
MELETAIRRRRMIRAFSPAPLESAAIDRLLDLARRGPSAGNTQAARFVVLDRPELVARYWDTTLPDGGPGAKRSSFRWQGLLDAPALILVTTEPQRYLSRYSQPDKAKAGRGGSTERWPVPYWWVDAGAVVQNLLLLAVESGLGACLFGPFDHEEAIKSEFGLADGTRIAATVAIGHPLPDEPGRSAARPRPPLDEVITRPRAAGRPTD